MTGNTQKSSGQGTCVGLGVCTSTPGPRQAPASRELVPPPPHPPAGWSRRRGLAEGSSGGHTRPLEASASSPKHQSERSGSSGRSQLSVWWPASGSGPPVLMVELRQVYLFLCPRATPPAACTLAEGRSHLSSVLSDLDVAFRQGWGCLLHMGFFRIIYEQKKTLK